MSKKVEFKSTDGKTTYHLDKDDIVGTKSMNNGHAFKDTDTLITTKDGNTYEVKERPSEVEKKIK